MMGAMTRINHHVTDRQLALLKSLSDATGLSVAELIRRAIDAMLERWDERRGQDKVGDKTQKGESDVKD
jgi:hypothetical protein